MFPRKAKAIIRMIHQRRVEDDVELDRSTLRAQTPAQDAGLTDARKDKTPGFCCRLAEYPLWLRDLPKCFRIHGNEFFGEPWKCRCMVT